MKFGLTTWLCWGFVVILRLLTETSWGLALAVELDLVVHPHRFRDTFAVDMLLKGLSPYDVAKILGDTIHTIETHYAPFIRELRERARRFIESEEGLEAPGTLWAHLHPSPKGIN